MHVVQNCVWMHVANLNTLIKEGSREMLPRYYNWVGGGPTELETITKLQKYCRILIDKI